jgi:hypothetical protein
MTRAGDDAERSDQPPAQQDQEYSRGEYHDGPPPGGWSGQ